MKVLLIPIITLIIGFGISELRQWKSFSEHYKSEGITVADTSDFDQDAALEKLRSQIRGKEELLASEVFSNIELFKQTTAGSLLNIMERGFSASLGVSCIHCHNPNDWSSDEKEEKQISREMSMMTTKINRKLLPAIQELGDRNAIVNCTTCHRGQKKPALRIN
ncbi:MAG: c-type cytochrome [Balneolaceae bacterium]|nr:c-type cytochrome [Balneolaceae bacterium]